MIREYRHGNAETDPELYALIGPWVVSRTLHEKLGMPITSEPGDIWLVSVDKNGNPIGFVQMHQFKNGNVHLRYLHGQTKPTRRALIKKSEEVAKAADAPMIYTNDRADKDIWAAQGYAQRPGQRRGDFVKWEKTLKEKE